MDKLCKECNQTKAREEFPIHGGRVCKACKAAITKHRMHTDPEFRAKFFKALNKWRAKNIDTVRRLNNQRHVILRQDPAYVASERAAKSKWDSANKDKISTYMKVQRALAAGTIERAEACEKCGNANARLEGHHEDYSQPLEVIWLCPKCHKATHIEKGRRKVC